jgi:hypothetical protein
MNSVRTEFGFRFRDGRGSPHRSLLRQLADDRRRIGSRRQLGDEFDDPTLGQVCRSHEQLVPVLPREERHELRDPAQVQAAVGEHRQQPRVLASRARDRDAQVGLGLGEVEPLGAVDEHRRAGLADVEPARIDLAEVSDEVGLDAARA